MTHDAIDIWKNFCFNKHEAVNQKYGTRPYAYHLQKVADNVEKYAYLVDYKHGKLIALFAAYGHDLIEDTRMTYSDVYDKVLEIISNHGTTFTSEQEENYFSTKVADTIYNLTDEKGKTRAGRKNAKYFEELRENMYAVLVKLCDILANTEHSKKTGNPMFGKYSKEFAKVEEYLNFPIFERIITEISELHD